MSDKYKTAVSPNLDRIAEMVSKGWSYAKIAKAIGLAPSTFKDYIKKYPELSAIIKKNAHARDVIVEDALYRRAKGEYATVKKPVKVKRIEYENGKKVREYEEVIESEETVYVPPDTGANIFWCVNHMPDKYKNNPHKLELDKERLEMAKKKAEQEDF